MYAAGFLILGIKYALFLPWWQRLLNLLPHRDDHCNLFCMLITLVSSENLGDVFWVAVIILVGHLIDNNFIMPGLWFQSKINALVPAGVLVGVRYAAFPACSFPSRAGCAEGDIDRVDSLSLRTLARREIIDPSDKPP